MNCVPRFEGKFKKQICDFVWLNRIQTTPFGLFTQIEDTYGIKRYTVVFRSSRTKREMSKDVYLYLDFKHPKRITILENVRYSIWELVNASTTRRKVWWREQILPSESEKGAIANFIAGSTTKQCTYEFLFHKQRSCWFPPQTLLWFCSHLQSSFLLFFWNLYFLLGIILATSVILWGHFLPQIHIVYFLFPALDAPWICW